MAEYLGTFQDAIVYACGECPEGKFGLTCALDSPSEIIWEKIIRTQSNPNDYPMGYDIEKGLCNQTDVTSVICVDGEVTEVHLTGDNHYVFIDMPTLGINPNWTFDGSESSDLEVIDMSNSGMSLTIAFTGLSNLRIFTCNRCAITGRFDVENHCPLLEVFDVASPSYGYSHGNVGDENASTQYVKYISFITSTNGTHFVYAPLYFYPSIVYYRVGCATDLYMLINLHNPHCSFARGDSEDQNIYTVLSGTTMFSDDNFYPGLVSLDLSGVQNLGVIPGYITLAAPNMVRFSCAYCGLIGDVPEPLWSIGSGVDILNVTIVEGYYSLLYEAPVGVFSVPNNTLSGDAITLLFNNSFTLLDISNNFFTCAVPSYLDTRALTFYLYGNDWDCTASMLGESYTDSSDFDLAFQCNIACGSTTDENCWEGHGGCHMTTSTCLCYEGYRNSAMFERNCAQDLSGAVLCDWIASLNEPEVFMASNPGFNCSIPLCFQTPTVANNYFVDYDPFSEIPPPVAPFYVCGEGVIYIVNILTNDTGAVLPTGLDNITYLNGFQFVFEDDSGEGAPRGCWPSGFVTSTSIQGFHIKYPGWDDGEGDGCSMPDFGGMTSLNFFSLDCQNWETEPDPEMDFYPWDPIWNMGNLAYLSIKNCPMDETHFPCSMSGLSNLIFLEFSNNQFYGTLPGDIFTFSDDLAVVIVTGNNIHGSIPTMALPTLQYINLSNNSLTGAIPEVFSNSSYFYNLGVAYFITPIGNNDFSCGLADYSFVGQSDWLTFQTNCSDCSDNPCLHDTLCTDTDIVLGVYCDCTGTNYRGPHCEFLIGSCDDNDCHGGSTCVPGDLETDYTCICAANQMGAHCGNTPNDNAEFSPIGSAGDPTTHKASSVINIGLENGFYLTSSNPHLFITAPIDGGEGGVFQSATYVMSGALYDSVCVTLQSQSTASVLVSFYLAGGEPDNNLTPNTTTRTFNIVFDNSICATNPHFGFNRTTVVHTTHQQLTFGILSLLPVGSEHATSLSCPSSVFYTPGFTAPLYTTLLFDNSIVPNLELIRHSLSVSEHSNVTFSYLTTCFITYTSSARKRFETTIIVIIGSVTYGPNDTSTTVYSTITSTIMSTAGPTATATATPTTTATVAPTVAAATNPVVTIGVICAVVGSILVMGLAVGLKVYYGKPESQVHSYRRTL
jgi:hypothetical protein